MKIYKLNQIQNPEYILYIINTLKTKFNEEIYPKYNKGKNGKPLFRDAESFYVYGHCPSFARILYETLEGNCKFYEDFSSNNSSIGHAIIKAGEHFYDASGVVDYLIEKYPQNFSECPNDYFGFYEEYNCSHHEHDEEIKMELIKYGKNIHTNFLINHNEQLIRKLSIPIKRD